MQLVISGLHLEISEALSQHVKESLEAFNKKHAIEPLEVNVQLSKEVSYAFRVDVAYHPSHGVVIRGHASGDDAYIAFENTLNLLTERIRRQKRRLAAHTKHSGYKTLPEAQYYVLSAEEPDLDKSDSLAPPVIAELKAEVPTLTVGEAVMRLDLAQQNAMMFYNVGHGKLNMVYRRADGNIGWVDPNE